MTSHIRSGDTVLHKSSGETWLVACCDGRELIACGWPMTFAKPSDCELLTACTDEKHREMLESWAAKSSYGTDDRVTVCRHQLFELNRGYVGAGI